MAVTLERGNEEAFSHFQCKDKITVMYCQAELDQQAFPNRVWERGKRALLVYFTRFRANMVTVP
jgi:hypothetical protein